MGVNPDSSIYRGRFAPSPTGPLHFGSLVAATASYLQALTQGGEWLLRIEDIDPPREVPGATDSIIRALYAHAFHWDGPVHYQSSHLDEYQAIAERLLADGLAYRCTCTREDIRRTAKSTGPTGPVYPETCRKLNRATTSGSPNALRFRTDSSIITFTDSLQGTISCNVRKTIGDFLIRRKDGLIAYNLATVIDDARQSITEVVRGCDLLDITPAQIELQQVLELPVPAYMHVPVVINDRGQKLSKQTGARPVNEQQPGANLYATLRFLRQNPPAELESAKVDAIWDWAKRHWNPQLLAARRQYRRNQIDN